MDVLDKNGINAQFFHRAYERLQKKATAATEDITLSADKLEKPEEMLQECLAAY